MSASIEHPALSAGLELLKQLERDGHLIKHPIGWQPPRLTIDDFANTLHIDRSHASESHSPSTAHSSTGIGVQIAGIDPTAPRHGGLPFFCTTSPHRGVR